MLISAKGAPAPRSAADLGGQTLVAFPHGCSYRRRLVEWMAEGGASAGRILELGSYHAIVACVAAGTGVAIVPAEMLDQAVLGTAVERHPLPERFRVNRTHLVWQGETSPPLRALMDLLPGAHKVGVIALMPWPSALRVPPCRFRLPQLRSARCVMLVIFHRPSALPNRNS